MVNPPSVLPVNLLHFVQTVYIVIVHATVMPAPSLFSKEQLYIFVIIAAFVSDDEDSPVIRGFSDDEPLVIA